MQTSTLPPEASGIDVAELPHVDNIEVPPASPSRTVSAEIALAEPTTEADAPAANEGVDEEAGDQRLVVIALAIVAVVAIAALGWALLV